MRQLALHKVAVVGILAASTVLASAVIAPQQAEAGVGCRNNNMPADPPDKGGRNAEAWYSQQSCGGSWSFKVSFQAYDEIIEVRKAGSLGAVVDVAVWNANGTAVVDRDTLKGKDRYNLGTPDGSGNVPEGRKVNFRLCVGAPHYACTAWASGRS